MVIDPIVLALTSQLRLSQPREVKLPQVECIADVVYHESRGSPLEAQIAVASAVLNREGEPCDVVKRPHQFAYRGKARKIKEPEAWRQAVEIALLTYAGVIETYGVTNFHDTTVTPYWARKFKYVGQVGKLKFWSYK